MIGFCSFQKTACSTQEGFVFLRRLGLVVVSRNAVSSESLCLDGQGGASLAPPHPASYHILLSRLHGLVFVILR